jgi:2-polyprenyl-3-methyl-5-hydroxy-6-metoxy-1,4-benzoquinol methylase
VEAHLPSPPARVLEVGCGEGRLAVALANQGYRVSAIDPRAPGGELFEAVSLEDFADPGPFDAVVASRSLHHIGDLSRAVAKIERLLRPGGRFIVNEHAFDRFDRRTAGWYLERRTEIDRGSPVSLDECVAEWAADHAGLHGYVRMRAELDRRFTACFFVWTPSLYGELRGAVDESEEQGLIDAGAIQATGFRYVGVPVDTGQG